MAFSLWNLFEATLLVLNAVCVLHEERFLAKMGWRTGQQHVQGFGEPPSAKAQILNLISSIRTVMRFPLIFVNVLVIVVKLLLGNSTMRRKFIEIAANLTDPMFEGNYHGRVKHPPDLDRVLERSWAAGVERIIVTGTTLEDSRRALEMSLSDSRLFCTVGCHPTNALDFEKNDPDEYLTELEALIKSNPVKVVALGECGLDYDRLHFCDKPTQLKYFEKQLQLASKLSIPLLLHCRAAHEDFTSLVRQFSSTGVVHSFDGTAQDARNLIEIGLHLGLNGCSLKTPDNLEVVSSLPVESLHFETDAPWCEVRPSHAGHKYIKTKFESVKKEKWSKEAMVKSRNEPAAIVQILEIVAAVKNLDEDRLCEQVYNNSLKTFFSRS